MTELNGYAAFKSSGLYPASGDSDDYMYKVDIGVGEKDTILHIHQRLELRFGLRHRISIQPVKILFSPIWYWPTCLAIM